MEDMVSVCLYNQVKENAVFKIVYWNANQIETISNVYIRYVFISFKNNYIISINKYCNNSCN